MIHFIAEHAGYQHLCTSNSNEALEILRRGNIDLFTQDIARPDINGLELYWLMKSEKILCDIPILIMSAWGSVDVSTIEAPGRPSKHLYKVEFKRDNIKIHRQILDTVADKPQGHTLYVEGYLRLPLGEDDFLTMVKQILEMHST